MMNDVLFQYIIDNQPLWAKQAEIRDRLLHLETLKKINEKNWFGKSKEYKREWNRERFITKTKRQTIQTNSEFPHHNPSHQSK
jgi:hypothetical protein